MAYSGIAVLVVVLAVCVSGRQYLDLSYVYDTNTMTWPSAKPFKISTVASGYRGDYWYANHEIEMSVHSGTHLDAPSHFYETSWTVDQIPLDRLVAKGVVIDIRDKVKDDPMALLTTDDLVAWLDDHGPLPDGVVVFVLTGWGARYGNKTAYFGTPNNDTSNLVFPSISGGAAQILAGYEATIGARVVGVGLDTPSTDASTSKDFATHVELAKANIYGLENVANLDKLPTTGFEVTVLPMRLGGSSGAPTRILATLPPMSNAAPSTTHITSAPMVLLLVALFLTI